MKHKKPLIGGTIILLALFVVVTLSSHDLAPPSPNTSSCLSVSGCPNITNNPPSGGGGGTTPSCIPSPEVCDGKDNNCNGQVDENGVCAPASTNYQTMSPSFASTAPIVCNNRAASLATAPRDYESVLTVQFSTPNIIQRIPCDLGTCLWVPWYSTSSSNNQADLKADCGTTDAEHNCMVTDEFSQVGMEIAMAKDREQDMIAFANTVRKLRGPKYGSIPVWKNKRSGNTISGAAGNYDTASDATGRILQALYIGANNMNYASSTRAMLKSLADTIAYDHLRYEYTHTCKPTARYGTVCHWLASGSEAGTGGLNWNEYSYGGYPGDVALGLLAAYESTGDPLFKSYAQDVARQYLAAAQYDSTKASVPPVRFNWQDNNGHLEPKCVGYCTGNGGYQWDVADAVRAVAICKAQYMASLNNVVLSRDLGTYCKQLTESTCYGSASWCVQLSADGSSTRPSQGGVLSNGLGSYLNFYQQQQDLQAKLNEIYNNHFGSGSPDGQPFGVYNNAFAVVNLGSAIGRDTPAYGSQTSGSFCTG